MSDLGLRFTTTQAAKLQQAGIATMYDFVTYLPASLSKIQPLQSFWAAEGQFLWQAKLLNFTIRKGRQPFLVLETEGKFKLQAYFFGMAQYTLGQLKTGQDYQFMVTHKNKFWTIQRFAPLKADELISHHFILGRAEQKEYLLPKYSTLNGLPSSYIIQLHRRLLPADYHLNLRGLVPSSDLIPEKIDLSKLHRPSDFESYLQTQSSWVALRVYLKLSLMRYLDSLNRQSFAPGTRLDVDFLKQITSRLPFELSQSQKLAIWEILNELKI
jgi:RecG-like helicase